jgi:hypothetical protein
MEVVRKHHPTVNVEGSLVPDFSHDGAQQLDVTHEKVVRMALQEIHREEVRTARNARTTIVWH